MATPIKVVLFEDTEQTRSEILNALKKHLQRSGSVIPFDRKLFTESDDDSKRMYEDRLENILRKAPYDGATLLVVDRDLSKSTNFGGLSDNTVAAAAKRLAVPICSYARQAAPEDYKWRARWEEGRIILSYETDDELARQAFLAARGFAEITAKLARTEKEKGGKPPAKTLAALLGKPEYSDKIALYSVGDQNRISEIPARVSRF